MPSVPLVPFENTPYSDPIFPGIPVPPENPQDEPQACLTYNANWQPILVALASRLTRYDAWQGDLDEQKLGVQKAHELIARIQQEFCPEGIPSDLCTNFAMENPFTTYFPGNPFTAPEFVPSGYNRPPFYTNVTNILFDIRPTDVVVDILGLNPGMTLPELVNFSFPRIHIDLEGTGECEIEFLQLLQGGFCTVTIDGNPFQAKIIDLNAINLTDIQSILSLLGVLFTGGSANRFVHEIQFDTIGDHTIDIVFYPHIAGEAIFGFGGGVGRIGFCSTSLDGDMRYMPITDMRVNQATCKWEAEYNGDGLWVEIGDYYIPACVPSAAPQTLIRDPGDGQLEQSLDGGQSYADIPNAKFLHIAADNDPLTGGLTIQSTDSANPSLIVIQPIAVPTVPLFSLRKSDNAPLLELLANLRLRFYGSTGNITLDQAGNDINFSRVGANFISALTAPATIQMRIAGLPSIMAHQNGRSTFGHSEQRSATMDALSQNVDWPIMSLRTIVGQNANLLEAVTSAATKTVIKPNGSIDITVSDGNVNSAPDGLVIGHEIGASAPLAGFGTSRRFVGKSSSTSAQNMALESVIWLDATHASRKAQYTLSVFDTSAREIFTAGATGTGPALGVLGALPSPRQNIGVIDCEGNEAAKSALDNLKLFGWVDGTINLGVAPEPEGGINTGVQVPTLPTLDTQGEQNLCSVAQFLAEAFGHWVAWNIQVAQFAADTRQYLDILNLDAYLDNDLNFFESNFRIEWGTFINLGTEWYLTHSSDVQTLLVSDAVLYSEQPLFINAIYAALRVTDTIFDENCLSLIQQNIGFIDSEFSFPTADAIGIIPIWYWQRLVYVALQGSGTGCEDLPPQEWSHFEQWIVDAWSGVVQTDGTWAFNNGYTTFALSPDLVQIEIPYSILTITITYNMGSGSGSPPVPTLHIEDLATGETVDHTPPDFGQYDYTWEAQIFPQGSEGLRISITAPDSGTGSFFGAGVTGYGPEIPN